MLMYLYHWRISKLSITHNFLDVTSVYVLAGVVIPIMLFVAVTLYFFRRLLILRRKIMPLLSGLNPERSSETRVLVYKTSELNPDAGDSILL
jgi:hypothetical protein